LGYIARYCTRLNQKGLSKGLSIAAVDESAGYEGEWLTPSGQNKKNPLRIARKNQVVYATKKEARTKLTPVGAFGSA
jgi:hypothetical protein